MKLKKTVESGAPLKKSNTAVSIITVSYNSAETIIDTIKSVQNQTYPHIEYIVVDGGSTDGTVDILRENDSVIDQWVSEPDGGIYDAMNKGIRMANGELVGILNSDDLYLPKTVRRAVEAYREADQTCVIYGDMTKFDSRGNEIYYEGDLSDRAFEKLDLQLNHPTCFVACTVYERYGGFDPWFEIGADRELMLRLYNAGVPRVYISDSLARFRLGGATSHSNLRRAFRVSWQNWVMYRRHGIAVKTALRRAGYMFLRRLAKSVLSLEHLRRIKEVVRSIPLLGAVWKTNGKNTTQKI
jgi:glycosyltransferase involved in cell wall biosynthesis